MQRLQSSWLTSLKLITETKVVIGASTEEMLLRPRTHQEIEDRPTKDVDHPLIHLIDLMRREEDPGTEARTENSQKRNTRAERKTTLTTHLLTRRISFCLRNLVLLVRKLKQPEIVNLGAK